MSPAGSVEPRLEENVMETHFHEQLQNLKKSLIEMASLVETSIVKSIRAVIGRDNALAEEVIRMDEEINLWELKIEEQCLNLLALHQPMASDLRFVTSAIKINNELERMGDHSVNIAEKALELNREKPLKPFLTIPRMAETVESMVQDSLKSFIDGDIAKAREVCIRDQVVDNSEDQLFRELLTYMMEDNKTISRAINILFVGKNLERIADLSTNISEEVIFIYDARTIKHHIEEKNIEDIRSR
jgi:phosphate transport system protein